MESYISHYPCPCKSDTERRTPIEAMPSVTSGKVLVTGANGYVGAWTLKAFLNAGFFVRGAIRDESKADHPKEVLAEHRDRLEFIVVPDITKVRRLARLIY